MDGQNIPEERRLEAIYVGNNYGYYARKWQGHENQAFFPSWNWAAFFFGAEWLVFRKMYLIAAITFLATYFIGFFTNAENFMVMSLLVRIVMGLSANALYCNQTRAKIQRLRAQSASSPLDESVRQSGGTSIMAVVIMDAALLLILFYVTFSGLS